MASESRRAGRSSSIDLAAGLARELQEPLTHLKDHFHALVASRHIAAEAHEDVAEVFVQLSRLQSTLNAFLKSATTDLRPPHLRPVDLGATVNEALLFLASASPEGTKLELEQDKALLPVFADETQLSQVISSLVLNALRSAGTQGRVTIKTGRTPEEDGARRVFFQLSLANTASVHANLLLNAFSLSQDEELGLALEIARRIVDMNGGDLIIDTPRKEDPQVAKFTILLPELVEYHI